MFCGLLLCGPGLGVIFLWLSAACQMRVANISIQREGAVSIARPEYANKSDHQRRNMHTYRFIYVEALAPLDFLIAANAIVRRIRSRGFYFACSK